jgi:hypothetical protein
MRKYWILIVFFTTGFTLLLLCTACTYDYFEDENNYVVYVPEMRDKTVDNCRVMIYDRSGLLVGDKSAVTLTSDPKLKLGLFSFRLPVGNYRVYCYANIEGVSFSGEKTYETSAFSLLEDAVEKCYLQPSDVFYDKFEHTVQSPGIHHFDTTAIERYIGRITVRFKNIPFDLSALSTIGLVAEKVASKQYLKHDTLTSYIVDGGVMKHTDDKNSISFSDGTLEVDHRYFPSVENNYETLTFTFTDSGGDILALIQVSIVDPDTGRPVHLGRGQRLIIEVDRYLVSTIRLVGWDENIESGGGIDIW